MYDPVKPYKKELLKRIQSTWNTPYVTVTPGIYPIMRKKFSYPEVQHADGIGTKGIYHWRKKTFREAAIDALAMNLNDLALMGAIPYALQDHITTPDSGHTSVLALMRALTSECKKRKIAIIGGETSHHDNMDAIDVGIVVSGFIKEKRKNQSKVRDVLIGLKSNGLHSNGFTKVRGMFGASEWRDDFTKPTKIYIDGVHNILKKYTVNGMMHITGGAFSKLKDILGKNNAIIEIPNKLKPQDIFFELYDRGVSNKDMYTTFNCGVGFVLSVPEEEAQKIIKSTPGSAVIGEVVRGPGNVHITSAFNGREVIL